MKSQRLSSSLPAFLCSTALCVAPLACGGGTQEDEGSSSAAKGADKPGTKANSAGATEAPSDDKPPGGGAGLVASARAAAVAAVGLRDITPHYAKKLDPLLDFVPADADSYVVIRDLGALVEGTIGYVNASAVGLGALATEIDKDDPGSGQELRDAIKKVAEFRKALAASGIDLSAGAVIAKRGDEQDVFIYGSVTANALPTMLVALAASEDVPDKCTTIASVPGYAVCSEADPGTYAPGSKAAELRKDLAAALPGVDLERANIVGNLKGDDGPNVPFAVETGQGMLHVAFSVPDKSEEIGKYLEPSKAPGLGLIGPGQPFFWAQGSQKEIESATAAAPAMAQGMLKTVTGEFVAGGIEGAKGLAILVGLSDPAPAAGLVALASLGLGEVPKELPDGTKLEVVVKTVHGTQAVHAKFEGGSQAAFFKEVGYVSEIFAFAAGHHAAMTFGAGEDVVKIVAEYAGSGPSEDMLAALPLPLARALEAGEATMAMHAPFDAFQATSTANALNALAEAMPAEAMPGIDAKAALEAFTNIVAPLSSTSFWITQKQSTPVFHLAIVGIAEPGTKEGDAALAAISAVAGGADRTTTWSAMATEWPTSPRGTAYKARAGQLGDPFSVMVVVAALGAGMGALVFVADKNEEVVVAPIPMPTSRH